MPGPRRVGARWRPLGVAGLVVVALGAGVALAWVARSTPPPGRTTAQPSRAVVPRSVLPPPARPAPAPSNQARAVPQPRPAPAPPAPSPQGRLAIVFDDAGGSLEGVEAIIAIGRPVTVAVLPYLAHSTEVARRARAAGLDVLLHLPLEPDDARKDPGPGGITVEMSDAAIYRAVQAALASVPGAVGINNHMGSRATTDRRVMRAVLRAARGAGVFFLDSYTTSQSVVREVAAEVGVRTATRAVFLDNEDEAAAIAAQIRRAIARARQEGRAIAIGHVQRLTPTVVTAMLHEFDEAGVVLVPVSALVR
ncbi:MAG: divergent polysaccharide deacetylase family protein [Armatimonadota bacterium]|nr:divergent polysaccharide deacetylase family protein [Armatimonadota bacterium]MDR7532839.1 divergent polysaccharide deacetylase family protein [Armatimonadota bacterium]MDR7535157.1 divergent polysaccharide deacetylase family protein [Armatimonadota bacterium]